MPMTQTAPGLRLRRIRLYTLGQVSVANEQI
jgi:hypothetical protein